MDGVGLGKFSRYSASELGLTFVGFQLFGPPFTRSGGGAGKLKVFGSAGVTLCTAPDGGFFDGQAVRLAVALLTASFTSPR